MSILLKVNAAVLVTAAAVAYGTPAYAQGCQPVSGRFVEIVAARFVTPTDPFGRVVSRAEGTINALGTAILTSVFPGPGGPPAWGATTRHVFVESAQDQLVATGVAKFTPIPGNFTDVEDNLTLTVKGDESLGRYAGATGTITFKGTGFNFYGPFPFPSVLPGSAYFVFKYDGANCFAGGNHDQNN
jgi:hypothetical protein